MKKALIAMIFAVTALHGNAQNAAGNFLPRANDKVNRKQVTYVAVNEGAENTVWDFTQCTTPCDSYYLTVTSLCQ